MQRRTALALALSLFLAAPAAHAAPVNVGMGLGAGYWFANTAQFDLNVRIAFPFAQHFSIGVRPGIALNVHTQAGVGFAMPLDAAFRFHISRTYVELIGGLWILFGNPVPLRGHAAAGLGVFLGRGFSIGIEGGWLYDGAQVLARFAFHF